MYLDLKKSKSDVYSCQPEVQILDNTEKNMHSRIIEGFRIKLTKKSTVAVQLLINFIVLLPPAAKRVECIYLSGSKQSFGRRDRADCKQRGTKWNAEGSRRITSQPASRKLCRRSDILNNPEKIRFSRLSGFSGHGRWKWTSDLNFARQNNYLE